MRKFIIIRHLAQAIFFKLEKIKKHEKHFFQYPITSIWTFLPFFCSYFLIIWALVTYITNYYCFLFIKKYKMINLKIWISQFRRKYEWALKIQSPLVSKVIEILTYFFVCVLLQPLLTFVYFFINIWDGQLTKCWKFRWYDME